MPGAYWLWPVRSACTAVSTTAGGPSRSGKPWPRLRLPVRTASADISEKIVGGTARSRSATRRLGGVTTMRPTVRRTGPTRDDRPPSAAGQHPTALSGGLHRVARMSDRDALLAQITDKAVVHGRVTLSSGKEADYYVDLRRITLDA